MDLIEQVIFVVDRKQSENSCQILDVTPGIHQVDLNEMMTWPLDIQVNFQIVRDETNPLLFFHSLPSGSYLLGKVIYNNDASTEVSRYYVHCLVLTTHTLEKFGNNSIFLYNVLKEKADFHFFDPDNHHFHISPFALEAVLEILDHDLFEALRDFPGPTGMATMVRSCIDSICSFFVDGPPPVQLLNGLIQCFPIHLRLDISFSTGLLFSQSHPLRIMMVDSHSPITRSICRDYVVPLFSFLSIKQHGFEKVDFKKYWPLFIYKVFKTGEFDFLLEKLENFASEPYSEHEMLLEWSQLQEIGHKFLVELDAKSPRSSEVRVSTKITSPHNGGHIRTDGVHPVFVSPDQQAGDLPLSGMADTPISTANLGKIYPDWSEDFRKLDSLTARALFGDHVALEALDKHWKAFSTQMTYLERGRISEAYIHLVQSILTQPRDPNFPKHPRRSIDALDVLNIFIDEH